MNKTIVLLIVLLIVLAAEHMSKPVGSPSILLFAIERGRAVLHQVTKP